MATCFTQDHWHCQRISGTFKASALRHLSIHDGTQSCYSPTPRSIQKLGEQVNTPLLQEILGNASRTDTTLDGSSSFKGQTLNFGLLDEYSKREIRRAILTAVAVPGYQVPFGSREMPVARGWGSGGLQISLAIVGPDDVVKVIDQGDDEGVNAVNLRRLIVSSTGIPESTTPEDSTLIQTRHRIPAGRIWNKIIASSDAIWANDARIINFRSRGRSRCRCCYSSVIRGRSSSIIFNSQSRGSCRCCYSGIILGHRSGRRGHFRGTAI